VALAWLTWQVTLQKVLKLVKPLKQLKVLKLVKTLKQLTVLRYVKTVKTVLTGKPFVKTF